MFIDPEVDPAPAPLRSSPLNALVVPRPIGWISTVSSDDVVNLAPFSYFNAVCGDPPCVAYCPNEAHIEGGGKDSLLNVEQTGEFVVNLVTWELREEMNATSAHVERGQNELAAAGLEAEPSVKVRPPRVRSSPAALECRYVETVRLPGEMNHLVIGRVVGIYISDHVVTEGRVDPWALRPVGRLGYTDYTTLGEVFSMPRPD